MKKLFLLFTAAALCAVVSGAPAGSTRFNPKAVSPRLIEVGSAPHHILAKGGKALCEIVLPGSANRTVRYAASELKNFLEQIIGSKVPVVTAPTGSRTAFLLGAAGARSINFELSKIDRDGYIIRSAGKNIVIAGTDDPQGHPEKRVMYMERGTLNGVYEFLERIGGVRFYFPGEMGTVVPRKADWSVGKINILDRPDNQFRRTYCVNVRKLGVSNKLITPGNMDEANLKRLEALRIRESTLLIPNCHGLRGLQLVKRFAKTKPEFFALRADKTRHDGSRIVRSDDADGQLCFTNEELKEVVYQDTKAFFTGKSAQSRGISVWHKQFFAGPFFNIMPNDALYPCRCATCQKVSLSNDPKATPAQKRQAVSNHIWKFKSDIARRLQKEGIPGFVTVMAYGSYKPIPTMDLPSNMIVHLALTGPWKECNIGPQARDMELLKAWQKKLGAKTYLWTYTTKIGNGMPYLPSFTPRAVGSFFKKAAPYSFGAFLEAELDYWIFNSMNFYVFGKVMWDTNVDVDALFKEHFQLMYGAAAREMEEFYNTIETKWLKNIMANIRETSDGPKAVLPSQIDVWTKIYSPAEIKRLTALFDRAEKLTANDPMANKRVKFMRKELFGPVLTGMAQFHKSNNDKTVWTIYADAPASPVVIDGKLDEAAWKKAESVYLMPHRHNAKIKEVNEVNTSVKMLSDKDYFYFAFECEEPFTSKMLCAPRKRDEIEMWRDNLVEIFIAPGHTSEIVYQFMLTSRGDVVDIRKSPGILSNKWNCDLVFKPGVVPGKKWIAEVKIPRKSMPELKGSKLAINFTRGRVLNEGGIVKVPHYTWFKFEKQSAENCGTVVLGKRPASQSAVLTGDFSAPVRGKRFCGAWFTTKVLKIDDKVFRTAGRSVRLEPVNGSQLLRQYLTKGNLKPSTRYRLSFFVKLENVKGKDSHPASGFHSMIRFGGSGESRFIVTNQSFQGTSDWRRMEYEFTTPADVNSKGKAYIEFGISLNATGTAWLDQVEMVPVASK